MNTTNSCVKCSRVRRLIGEGEVAAAAQLLTQPYRIRGMVTHGAHRGRQIGFPTANLEAIDTLVPSAGVYAGRAWIGGVAWPAAINVGANPTFGERNAKLEVHVIGFDGSLYGTPLETDFLLRLRDIHSFASPDHLITQLQRDVARTEEVVRSYNNNAPGDLHDGS